MGWQDRPYNQDGGNGLRFGFVPPSPMALGVMAACFLVFVLQSFAGPFLFDHFQLDFVGGKALYQPWRFVTYQYLHETPWHIFFNLLGIYFFLSPLERLWGPQRALAFYTVGGVVGGLTFGLLHAIDPVMGQLVGASGSILASLGACALLFPEQTVLLLVFPVPIRLLAVLLALLFTLTVIGEHHGGDACHLGGLAYGVLAPYYGSGLWSRTSRQYKSRRLIREREIERSEQEAIDRILQKVSEHGMNSLSGGERRTLKRATERQRRNDAQYARNRR
jgi:membrane associated rhomboid family serine protease